jgi:hypothetical protein
MSEYSNKQCPPVILLVFNRPDLTEQVFRQIRKAQPSQLFVAADGPREDHPDDRALCQNARAVATQVDWDCEVHTLFRSENLGTRNAISSAISWFFDHVDEGIILEDDCLAAKSFFPFCSSLLEKYRDDERIVMVSGNNPLSPWRSNEQSYHFSNYGGIWGWATWGDQWTAYHEARETDNPRAIERVLNNVLVEPEQVAQRTQAISRVFNGEIDSWGYQWFWTRMLQNKLSIVPARNLVSNIGFGAEASRTTNADDPRADLPLEDVSFPLSPPNGTYPDRAYDAEWFQITHGSNGHSSSSWEVLRSRLKRLVSSLVK